MSAPASDRRALLKEALEAVERLQARVAQLESGRSEPIAIIGLACRFPGGASTPEKYWALLRDGVDAVTEVPADRWDARAWARLSEPDGVAPKFHGGFLEAIDRFDPRFFGISPREASTMDPQQRLLLEVVWEALERAGHAPDRLAGSRTGVFVGITTSDYGELVKERGREDLDVYVATGSAHNAAAGRVSYVLGLRGPCMAIDTACSSSLTAVHLACQSLRAGESRMALAGGVNAILTPDPFVIFSRWGMMAPDGRCKTFDVHADGFVRAEGCGIIVLKRLSDAVADGDTVLAVIRGSAVNQDGASSGLTVPSGLAQQDVVRQALAGAGVAPHDVSYVEAHGTGTSLGDPIELEALLAVLGEARPADRPLTVGSVKTNLGHLESASGVAGLIKVVLSLQHGEIPPHLHFNTLTPKVAPGPVPLVIPTRLTPWTAGSTPRVAGVSSFGFSGTNAHVILEEPATPSRMPVETERPWHLLPLSARTEAALGEQAARLAETLKTTPDAALADACFTLATGRALLPHRLAVPVTSVAQARAALTAAAAGGPGADVRRGRVRAARPKIAFLFTGQGAQYAGMGRGLYESCPPFRRALERCEQILTGHLDRPLRALLYPDAGAEAPLHETRYTQPTLFALEYALAETWRAWGVTPALVLGHSVGEYVAACVAGVLSLEDALPIIAARGRLMQALPGGGAMAAVLADEATVARAIAPHAASLAIAAVNGPESVVVSGDGAALLEVVERLTAAGIKTERLNVSHAFHSPLMDPMLDEFERLVARARLGRPRLGQVSNVTGRLIGADEPLDAAYWRRHVRQPVRFADGVAALREAGADVFVEIGPAPTLLGLARRCLPDVAGPWLPSLRRGRDDWAQMLDALAALHVEGVRIDWAEFDGPYARRRVTLPTYPFQRERCWVEAPAAPALPALPAGTHPLLGRRLELAALGDTTVWEGRLALAEQRYLSDHRVQGQAIVPATAYLEMMLAAAATAFGEAPVAVTDIRLDKPIFLNDDASYRVQVTLRRAADDRVAIEVHGAAPTETGLDSSWTLHASASVARAAAGSVTESLDEVRARCADEVTGDVFYARLAERGNEWGATFRGLSRLWRGEDEALSEVHVPEAIARECSRYRIHPAVADATGHVLVATIPLEGSGEALGGAFVGGGIDRIRFHRAPRGTRLWSHARRRQQADDAPNVLTGDVTLYDEAGIVAELHGAHLWYLAGSAGLDVDAWFHELSWRPRPRGSEATAAPAVDGSWLVLADGCGAGERLARALAAAGAHCVTALAGDRYEQLGPGAFSVRPHVADDLRRLLGDGLAASGGAWHGIAHLWSLDAARAEGLTVSGLDAAAALSCGSVSALLAALDGTTGTAPRLWLVTRGAQRVGQERTPPAVAQSPLWGLGRSLALEHAEVWGGLIDLDPDAEIADAVRPLVTELTAPDGEDQMAFRGEIRHAARLVRRLSSPASRMPVACRADATYLVTGGLGGLGLAVARWLVERGARHLVLLGRTGLPPREDWPGLAAGSRPGRQVAAIAAMEAAGAEVRVAAADVGDDIQLADVVTGLKRDGWPSLRGVVHAAGVMRYQALAALTPDDLADALRAKLRGTWSLQAAVAAEPLDFFVLFSSASALLSSPMIGAYAAGNAFLDAVAQWRRAQGRPAVSINWGLWTGVGMAEAVDTEQVATAAARGLGGIEVERGLAALARVMAENPVQVAVLPVDWEAWRQQYPVLSGVPLLQEVMRPDGAQPRPGAARVALRGLEPEERRHSVREHVIAELAAVLRLSPGDLDPTVAIGTLGLDSLMSVEVKHRLEEILGVAVPMARLLAGPSALELTDLLDAMIGAEHAAVTSPVPEVVPSDAEPGAPYPLSRGQEALWFMHHLAPTSPAYNVVFTARIRSRVDLERLQRALRLAVERHPTLASVFGVETGSLRQRATDVPVTLEPVDIGGDGVRGLADAVHQAAREPFDLGRAVMRARLFSRAADDHVLLLVVHHIAFDAWSFEVLLRELRETYGALTTGRPVVLPALPARYIDFVDWQERLLASEAGRRQRVYWEAELAGELPTLQMPTDLPRAEVPAFRGASRAFVIPAPLTTAVRRHAAAEGVTPYTVLAAAYALFLHRQTGQEEILVGSPTAGRTRPEFANVVGYFVNMAVLRVRVDGRAPFRALLHQVRDKTVRMLEHQDYPFALLVRDLRTARHSGRTPVFQAAFNFIRTQQGDDLAHFFIDGMSGDPLTMGDLVLEPFPVAQQEGQFELELQIADAGETMCARLKYDPDLYRPQTAERLVGELQTLLACVVGAGGRPDATQVREDWEEVEL
jgi:acyl transferase domain-containing protein